ncbi:MAG: hypothetical protein V7739_15845 [Motiliproteus sp.]
MSKEQQDFFSRPEEEQQAFLNQTWCNDCMKADLGMKEPEEYIQDGKRYVEGKCNSCGNSIVTELTNDDF